MRVLLDENLDHRLRRSCNGELLELASREVDAFITGDQNLQYQQNVARYNLGIIVLVAQSNRLADMQPLIPRVGEVLPTLRPGTGVCVAATISPEVPETHNRGTSGRS